MRHFPLVILTTAALFAFTPQAKAATAPASWFCMNETGGCPDVVSACQNLAAFRGVPLNSIIPWYDDYGQIKGADCHMTWHQPDWTERTYVSCPVGGGWEVVGTFDAICVLNVPMRRPAPHEAGAGCGDPQPMAGNPISIASGNKFERVEDFSTAGARRLEFVRYYNSMLLPQDKGFGANWRHTYSSSVFFVYAALGQYRVIMADGQGIDFQQQNDGTFLPGHNGFGHTAYKLVKTASTFVFTDLEDTVQTFDATDGKLLSIKERDGYERTLNYDADGQLQKVTDSYGRTLQFGWANGRIATMTDSEGRLYRYTVDKPDSLMDKGDRLIGVTYPDALNSRISYLYENSLFRHGLTGIVNEKGVRFATFGYDDSFRANSTEHAGGAGKETIAFDVADRTHRVTNALGKNTTYEFDFWTHRPVKVTGEPSANCIGANRAYSYDANGFLASVTDWNGNVTQFTNDARGLQLKRIEAAGTSAERTTTTEWHTTFRLPTKIIEPLKTTTFKYNAQGWLTQKTETDTSSQTVPYSTNGQSRTWNYTYDALGQLISINGPRLDVNDVTTFAYDNKGNRTSIKNPLNQETKITSFNERGLPLTMTAPTGVTTTLTYNERGWLTSRPIRKLASQYLQGFETNPCRFCFHEEIRV